MPADNVAWAQAASAGAQRERSLLERLCNAPFLISAAASLFYLHFLTRGSVAWNGRIYFTLFDDAMISMRYAKTLASGGGFTWNPGEPPIEGITNPLWTLWMAVLHFAPVGEGYVALLVGLSSAACLLGAAFGARALARRLGAGEQTALLVLGVVAFYYPLAFWSLRGMETGVLACLMTWATVLTLDQLEGPTPQHLLALALIAVALVWVRQDAVVFVTVLAGFALAAGTTRARWTAASLAGSMIAALALLTLFRLVYYGAALPNTYYLKVTGVTLGERLVRGLASLFSPEMCWHFLAIALTFALSVPALRRLPRTLLVRMALPLAAFLAQAAYSVYVGGDVWEMMGYPNRYLVIVLPGLLALAVVLMVKIGEWIVDASAGSRLATAALVVLMLAQTTLAPGWAAFRHGAAYVEYDRAATQVGLCLRESTPPGSRIAYTWAGAMPYYADRFGIDLLGKMDAHIARARPQIAFEPGHNKWDYAYSIDTHRPDIILQLFRAKPGDHDMIRARGYREVARDWPCLRNTFLAPGDVFVRAR